MCGRGHGGSLSSRAASVLSCSLNSNCFSSRIAKFLRNTSRGGGVVKRQSWLRCRRVVLDGDKDKAPVVCQRESHENFRGESCWKITPLCITRSSLLAVMCVARHRLCAGDALSRTFFLPLKQGHESQLLWGWGEEGGGHHLRSSLGPWVCLQWL